MDMGTSTAMAMATTATSMDMGSSSTSMPHSHGGSDMHMKMSDMAMTFFTSFETPLFADNWTPTSMGEYAGTCIFLIALAVILRVLLALKPILETRFWSGSSSSSSSSLRSSSLDLDNPKLLPGGAALRAVGQDVGRRWWSGWRIGASAQRATYELIIIGVGYLLMLAVMTMNVGYFLSVLAGAWFGTFMLGALANDIRFDHC